MKDTDKRKFLESITGCAAIYRVELKNPQIAIYWELLKEFETDQVLYAIQQHLKTAKFFPVPAELIDLIPSASASKHIGADEAWSLCISSFDERATVVITQQIAEARAIALPIWNSGDEIGARVAFRDAYNRLLKTAQSPQWHVSIGFDTNGRVDAISDAVAKGRLSSAVAEKYKIQSKPADVSFAGLLESAKKRDPSVAETAKKNLQKLKAAMNAASEDAILQREKLRNDFEQHRQDLLSAVDKKMADAGVLPA